MRLANSSALPPAACQSTTSPFSGRLGNSRTRIRLALEDRLSAIAVTCSRPTGSLSGKQHDVGALQECAVLRASTCSRPRRSRSRENRSCE